VKHQRDNSVERKSLTSIEQKVLEAIGNEGSIRTDRLREKLKLEAKENNSKFHRSLTNLESRALIVGVEDPHPEKHLHANIWQTWDTRTAEEIGRGAVSYNKALANLLVKTVDACVLARENQIPKWFEWSSDMQAAKEQLLLDGAILKLGGYIVSTKVRSVNN
jgi:hypothetical protein